MTLLDEIRTAASTGHGSGRALPFGAYSDSDVFRLERERVFASEWIALCPAASLAQPGDSFAHPIGGEPVVVVRGEDGALRALSNVCRHRGTLLRDDGLASNKKFVCPYHAWTYDLEGSLLGIPHPGNVKVDKAAHCLPRFQVEEWAGVVFVNLDPEASSLSSRLQGLEPYLAPFDMKGFDTVAAEPRPETWKANWKLILENGMESYHLFKVHQETLEKVSPTKGAFYIDGAAAWSATGGVYTNVDPGSLDETSTQSLVGTGYVLVSIPPSFVGILVEDSWGWISVLPTEVDESTVVGGALRRGAPGLLEKMGGSFGDSFTAAFLAEDKFICERGQRGMASRRSAGGQLVELENVVVDFHQYLAARLFDSA